MAQFAVRVELHDADEEDYETLHDAMEEVGFSRSINSDDGVTYLLPPAEYDLELNATAMQVLELAKEAAATTEREYEVLVTEAGERAWFGLEEAE